MNQDLKLEFKCPVDIKGMPKCDGGYACQQCEKPVFDYTKMDLEGFEGKAQDNRVVSQCGVYKAYQVADSYGDWRDKVTKTYRGTIRKAKAKKRYMALLPFIAGFMFLIGCGTRHVCGMMVDSGFEIPQQDSVLTPVDKSVD